MYYALVAFAMLLFLLLLASMRLDYFDVYAVRGAQSPGAMFDLGRVAANFSALLHALASYHGAALALIIGISAMIAIKRRTRIMLALLSGSAAYLLAMILIGGNLSVRYFLPALPLLLVSGGVALALLCQAISARWPFAPLLVALALGLWVVSVALPFMAAITGAAPPTADSLPHSDYVEYVRNDSSGYGVRELAHWLAALSESEAVEVDGAIANCLALKVMLFQADDVRVRCPDVLAAGKRERFMRDYPALAASRSARNFLALEEPGYVTIQDLAGVALELAAEFPRPGGESVVLLYEVET